MKEDGAVPQAAQAMGQAALSMAGMPGAADAAAALLQQGQAAALRAAQVRAHNQALQAARERNEQLTEKRQDDLVNGAAVSACLQRLYGAGPIRPNAAACQC